MYIKHEDKWEKDEEQKKIHKNVIQIQRSASRFYQKWFYI